MEPNVSKTFITAINFYHLSSLNLFWGKTKQIANFSSLFFVALRRKSCLLTSHCEGVLQRRDAWPKHCEQLTHLWAYSTAEYCAPVRCHPVHELNDETRLDSTPLLPVSVQAVQQPGVVQR